MHELYAKKRKQAGGDVGERAVTRNKAKKGQEGFVEQTTRKK